MIFKNMWTPNTNTEFSLSFHAIYLRHGGYSVACISWKVYLFHLHNMLPKIVIGLKSFIKRLLRNSLTSVLFVSCCRWPARIYQWRPGRRFDRDSSPWNPVTFVRRRKSIQCGTSALRYHYNADIWRTRFWKIYEHIQSDVRNANKKGIQKQHKR